jgi:L-asparaginase
MSVTVIPYGGSINETDSLLRVSSQGNGIGKYLVNNVHLGLLGLRKSSVEAGSPQAAAMQPIGQNSMAPCLVQKDSARLNSDDRRQLLGQIRQCNADMILIPMGTTKAIETANYISKNLPPEFLREKLVVFTASHDLFSHHPGDGKFNLGYAHAQRLSSERGVRIAIHAGVFKPDEVCIDSEPRGIFFTNENQEAACSPVASDLLLIGFGGTIEGQEQSIEQRFAGGFSHPYIKEKIVPKQQPHFVDLAIQCDSRELTERHIQQLKATIRHAKQTEFVVTVGTFKVEEVGRRLVDDVDFMEMIHQAGKRVVFAVACELPTKQDSDAFYNLGFALGAVPHVTPGIYLSVHGLISEIGAMTKRMSGVRPYAYFAPAAK